MTAKGISREGRVMKKSGAEGWSEKKRRRVKKPKPFRMAKGNGVETKPKVLAAGRGN